MIKRRVIICMTFVDGVLFRTKRFVPDYRYTQSFVTMESVDELVLLHVGGGKDKFYETLDDITAKAFVPIAVGGRIETAEEARNLFRLGADKVVLGHQSPFYEQLSHSLGAQSVVAGIESGHGYDVVEKARELERRGAGEILLQSVDRDGSLEGYDLETCERVAAEVSVPVVLGSGCGNWSHMAAGFQAGADACSTACIFHFTEPSMAAAKRYLREHGIAVR